MNSHLVEIRNCNNINNAHIEIFDAKLNIKLGYNGTGKSTISRAIRYKADGENEKLKLLQPYSDVDPSKDDFPFVGDISFKTVKVFDEEYINSYLFKPEGIFTDSYSVLLRDSECDALAAKINILLSDLQDSIFYGDSIKTLISTLESYFSAVNYSESGISKRGGIGEVLKGWGAGFEKHEELKRYEAFYRSPANRVVSWATWRTKGIEQMNGGLCPFCATELDETEMEVQNTKIKTVFKKSALDTAGKIFAFINQGIEKEYIVPDVRSVIEGYMGDDARQEELQSELNHLAEETKYLHDKLQKIVKFRPMVVSADVLTTLEDSLKSMQIDNRLIKQFYATKKTRDIVAEINSKIQSLLESADSLKNLFFRHNAKLKKLIKKRKDDINYFFRLAGFPYEFDMRESGEKQAYTSLRPVGQKTSITNPKDHLSWGERNAFSLVMFMFEAVSEEADLIVLDDPISSFDANKKFAVIRRMFDNHQDVSFRDRTVLLLTHDHQPVIDYVHGKFFQKYGLTTKVSAKYLENSKGSIIEHEILGSDLFNVVGLTRSFAEDDKKPLYVRVVNFRKYIELTEQNYHEKECYDIMSNLIHGRSFPLDSSKKDMSAEAIQKGISQLRKFIDEYDSYEGMLEELSTDYLFEELAKDNPYYKILAIRLLFERCSGLMNGLRREHPEACKFLNETNHIENDYLFQLNPEKFFSIPEIYVQEIREYLEKHKEKIEIA